MPVFRNIQYIAFAANVPLDVGSVFLTLSLCFDVPSFTSLQMARDMAMLEAALSTLTPSANLGGSYTELRAYRQLLFLELPSNVTGQQQCETLLAATCTQQCRPSTVLHYLSSRCPVEFSSPHVYRRKIQQASGNTTGTTSSAAYASSGKEGSIAAYLDWLLRGSAGAEWRQRHPAHGDTHPSHQHAIKGPFSLLQTDVSSEAEHAAWGILQGAVDEYYLRMSVTDQDHGSSTEVKLVEHCGTPLLDAYKPSLD